MAAPTSPTENALVSEGLKQAGVRSPTTTQINRAIDRWLPAIKNYIWDRSKGKFKSLQTVDLFAIKTAGGATDTEGRAVYDNPDDFASHISMNLMTGDNYGVCQAGGSMTTAILSSAETLTAGEAIGRELVIYVTVTPTIAYSSWITNYDTSTKVATFSPAISISPKADNSYVVINSYKDIEIKPMFRYDQMTQYGRRGEPQIAFPMGTYTDDEDGLGANNTGQFMLYPFPYFSSDEKPRIIRHNYYKNLIRTDTTEGSGYKYTAILEKWELVWVQGIKAWFLMDVDDSRADREFQKFDSMVQGLISKETYGYDLSNMQQQVREDSQVFNGVVLRR